MSKDAAWPPQGNDAAADDASPDDAATVTHRRKVKKTIIRIGLIILILLLISVSVWLAIKFNQKRLDIESLQAELKLEHVLKAAMQKEFSSTKDELDKVKTELDNTQKQLNEVNSKLAASESNNAELIEEKKALEARLHSLKELRQAVGEIKQEMWQERYRQILVKKEMQKQIDAYKLAEGNRGFLLKDSKPTYKPAVKIEVRPGY